GTASRTSTPATLRSPSRPSPNLQRPALGTEGDAPLHIRREVRPLHEYEGARPLQLLAARAQVIEPPTTISAPATDREFNPSAATSPSPKCSTTHIPAIVKSGAVASTAETRERSQ